MQFKIPFYRKEKNIFTKYEKRFISEVEKISYNNLDIENHNLSSFKHSGNCGDILYSLPTVLALSTQKTSNFYLNINKKGNYTKGFNHPLGGVMLNHKMAEMLRPLLEYQDYIDNCTLYETQPIDIDLDLVRNVPLLLDRGNIARWYFQVFGTNYDLNKTWLKARKNTQTEGAIVIARSTRYNSPLIDYSFLAKYSNIQFVGLEQEFYAMKKMIPTIIYREVNDFLEMADIINSSRLFIGNQSFPFAIAEALKVNRILEVYFKCPNVTVYGENGFDFCFQPQFEKLVKQAYQ